MTKSIMIDLDDPRTGKIADVISNKTSKKILSLLSEQELSETYISKNLGIPLNTVGYSIDKLEQAGLIEKSKDFYWSAKGKKIHKYKVSNKRIIISPKSMIRGIIPSVIAVVLLALGIKIFSASQVATNDSTLASSGTSEAMKAIEPYAVSQIVPALSNMAWAWFLLGALTAILIFILWNIKKGSFLNAIRIQRILKSNERR
ncbi:winged helix-turn-helix transcriptional regulator [Candidatus Pacearchaeota archaeon]|nr:winged helix-turn-helix transcriptional regulator [Candidatus Pacearchaeota archaeon]